MKKTLSPAQLAAKAERKARFTALVQKVAQMSEQERAQITIAAGAVVTCEGRALSPRNTMLLLLQLPGVSMVGGFRQWLAKGRAVRKGEHGACILVPVMHKAADGSETTDADGVRFVSGTVFDISQTDELPAAVAPF